MEKKICSTCFKPKATLVCGLCSDPICKSCAQFLEEESFLFLPLRPPESLQTTFCGPCFDAQVAPILENYSQTLERAKEILIFTKTQNKETRFIRRDEDRIHITACSDREEVVMRLAFQAAQRNFNGVIDMEVSTRKVRDGSYQTTEWTGSGIPAHVNPEKLVKDRSFTD